MPTLTDGLLLGLPVLAVLLIVQHWRVQHWKSEVAGYAETLYKAREALELMTRAHTKLAEDFHEARRIVRKFRHVLGNVELVYDGLLPHHKRRTSSENVRDTLESAWRLLNKD